MKPRVGRIDFLNCLPLTYSFQHEPGNDISVTADVPARLNSAVIAQRLDVSPVSSIVYARNSGELLVLPDVSITADGMVQSIILVSKKPMEELTGDKVVLTAKSATSHCLLKIVMQKAYGALPEYEIRAVDPAQPVPKDAAASLLIGDDALFVNHHHESGLYYYDIGTEWKKLTGLCMVYAVWVANRSFAQDRPRDLQVVYERIVKGFRDGYRDKSRAIAMILDQKPFSAAQLEEYLEVIKWDFAARHKQALRKFYELSFELGLIKTIPEIKMAEVIRCV